MANDRIPEILERFAVEIRAEFRRQTIDALGSGFGGDKKLNGHVAKSESRSSTPKPPSTGSRTGRKRDPKSIDQLQGKLGSFIARHPGLRIEEINKQLGTNTKELALPIKKLIAAKAIKTKGAKRSTKYFPKA